MKVPTLVTTRTQSPAQVSQYSNNRADPRAFGAGVGSALADFGKAISGVAAKFEEREQKTERFGALRNFSEFETQAAASLTELQRNSDPSGKGFARMAEDQYDREMNAFLNSKVPAALQDEFHYRATQVKQTIVKNALDFQYKAGDAFFRQGVSDEYNKALTALDPRTGGSADQLDAYKKRMAETIAATDLSEIEKAELLRGVNRGLEGVGYRAAVANEARVNPGAKISGSVGGIIDEAAARYGQDAAVLRGIAWLESRGNPNAKNPKSSAGGLFQFIDSTARAYGLGDKFDAGASADAGARLLRDNREALTRALGRDPSPGELYLAHQQGSAGAIKLLSNPDARAVDIVGGDAIKLNGGHPDMTAKAFANLWIRKMEGAGGHNLDTDARFSNVPYEDKLALREDAMRDIAAEQTAEAKARDQAYSSSLNTLLTGIHDGQAGKTDIDAFRAMNPEMPFADIEKMDAALKKYDEGLSLGAATLAKIEGGGVIDPTSTDDKKGMNAIIGKDGLENIANADQEYFSTAVVPLVQKAGDIPTDVVGALMGMIRSNNQTSAIFALDALSQLQDADFRAYNARVPKATQDDVEFWRARRTSMPHDELLKLVNGGVDQAERQARITLRTEAEDYLGTKVNKIPTLKTLVDNVVGSFDTWFSSAPQLSSLPWAAKGLQADFQTEFINQYERFGNVDEAVNATTEILKRSWGVTEVGSKVIMKYPPEAAGYKPYNGSYQWIDDQVRTEYDLPPDQKFELVSDDKTQEEFEAWKRGADQPPSYQICTFDTSGVCRAKDDRMFFVVPEEVKVADELRTNAQNEMLQLRRDLEEATKTVHDARVLGQEVDPTELEEIEAMSNKYFELKQGLQKDWETPTDYETRWKNRMQGPQLPKGEYLSKRDGG